MADIQTGTDSVPHSVDNVSKIQMESIAQSLSQPGDKLPSTQATNADNTNKLVNTGVLPDMLILDDADRPATGPNSMKSAGVEQAAADIAKVVKESTPQTLGDNVANAINNSVHAGANLTELVEDLNKDLADSRFPKAQHATFKTDESGHESILVKPGPFGGQNFNVQADNTVTVGITNR